jgi:hypothetical protein
MMTTARSNTDLSTASTRAPGAVTTKTWLPSNLNFLLTQPPTGPPQAAAPLRGSVEPGPSVASAYCMSVCNVPTRVGSQRTQIACNRMEERLMVLLLALLLVLIFFGLGFAVHLLWIAAVVLLVLWVIGFAVGRGESAGTHRFYRW